MNTHHTEAYTHVGLCSLPQPLFAEGSATAHLTHPGGPGVPLSLVRETRGELPGSIFYSFFQAGG